MVQAGVGGQWKTASEGPGPLPQYHRGGLEEGSVLSSWAMVSPPTLLLVILGLGSDLWSPRGSGRIPFVCQMFQGSCPVIQPSPRLTRLFLWPFPMGLIFEALCQSASHLPSDALHCVMPFWKCDGLQLAVTLTTGMKASGEKKKIHLSRVE